MVVQLDNLKRWLVKAYFTYVPYLYPFSSCAHRHSTSVENQDLQPNYSSLLHIIGGLRNTAERLCITIILFRALLLALLHITSGFLLTLAQNAMPTSNTAILGSCVQDQAYVVPA